MTTVGQFAAVINAPRLRRSFRFKEDSDCMLDVEPMRTRAWRFVSGGIIVALAVGLSGPLVERLKYGATDDDTLVRVEAELRARFDADSTLLTGVATRATAKDAIRAALLDPSDKRLFDEVAAAVPRDQAGRVGVTVYDPAARPLAWAGRVSDLPKTLVTGLSALVTFRGALGPRLVRVEPVSVNPRNAPASTRDATIVVEESLADPRQTPGPADTAVMATSLVPVIVRTPFATRDIAPDIPPTANYTFSVLAPNGAVLADAEVSRQDVRSARAVLRSRMWALSLAIFSATVLLAIGPLLNRRRRANTRTEFLALTVGVAAAVLAARSLALSALSAFADVQPRDSPLNVLVTGLAAMGLVALAMTTVERWRVSKQHPRVAPQKHIRAVVLFLVAGAVGAGIVVAYERFLQRVVTLTHLDVLHFSLHPFDVPRFAVGFGLIAMHAAVIWGVALLFHTIRIWARVSRTALISTAGIWFVAAGVTVFVASTATT